MPIRCLTDRGTRLWLPSGRRTVGVSLRRVRHSELPLLKSATEVG
jgi:hypothetical protein